MTTHIARRFLSLVPTWLGISLLAFILASMSPGDPAQLILNRQLEEPPTAQQLDEFREKNGLNDPKPLQYIHFVGDLLHGDLGTSFVTGRPVSAEISSRMGPTLQLALPAFALSVFISIVFGAVAALGQNGLADHVSRLVALLFESVPTFVLAYALIIVFSVKLGLLPVAGRGGLDHLVLPVVTLALATTAGLMRLTRSSLLDVLREDYVRTARALGLRGRTILFQLALKNALIPVVTVAALIFAGFVTGTVIIETVFSWPGVGRFVVDSIFARDYAVIQGFVVVTGTIFVLVNLVVDVLYAVLDPRVRFEGRSRGI